METITITAGDLLELKKKVDGEFNEPMADDVLKYKTLYRYKPFSVQDTNGIHLQEGLFMNIKEKGNDVNIITGLPRPVAGRRETSTEYPKNTELVFSDIAFGGRRKIRRTRRRKIRRTRRRKSRHR